MKIIGTEDFGLCFNCLIRLYKWRYDLELLHLIGRICDEYLCYFSVRTVFCSLRDLLQEKNDTFNQRIPQSHNIRFESLLIKLTRQYIILTCTKDMNPYAKEEKIRGLGAEAGFVKGIYDDARFQTHDEFRKWLTEKQLDKSVEQYVQAHKNVLPIKKSFYKDFQAVCIHMIQYSVGRKTYMPITCYTFIKNNMPLLSEETRKELYEHIDRFSDGKDDEYWRRLKAVLNISYTTFHKHEYII